MTNNKFEKENNFFLISVKYLPISEICQTPSAPPWFHLFQGTDAQNTFLMLLNLSYTLQQHSTIEKKPVRNFKAKNKLKTDWFDSEYKEKLKMKQKSFLAY